MMFFRSLAVFAGLLSAAWAASGSVAACNSLQSKINIANVTVNFVNYVLAGTNLTFSQAGNLSTCNRPFQVVSQDLCRVAMRVTTSNRSEITLEAWFPTNWTGRFLSTGNGGISGYEDISYGTQFGFATVGANNGHNGTAGGAFYNNPDIVADYAYRSIHTGVVVGKALTQLYYGTNFNKSYYLGCSTGGRQGFKEVQDYPEDFDGVVVGAPALALNNLTSWSGHFYGILGNVNASTFVNAASWSLIHNEILNQCDGIDGVRDGIVEDPLLCQFRPEALQCTPGNTTNCLTSVQVDAVRQVFSAYYGVNGSLIYPRMNPGGELLTVNFYYTGKDFVYTTDWFRYAIYNDPTWDPTKQNIQDAENAYLKDPSGVQTWKGDLSAFKQRGGKILHYHGQQDWLISSDNSPRYYDYVSRTMGLPSSSLDSFYRFFRISGMGHCSGGPGAWQIGQTYNGAVGLSRTADYNILQRMVEWVENGAAPEYVMGTKFVNDTPALGVQLVRKHCKYPKRNFCTLPARNATSDGWTCI